MAGILPKDKQIHFSIHLPAGFLLLVKQHTTVGRSHAPRRVDEAPVFTASALCRGVGRTRRAVCRRTQRCGSASNRLTPEHAVALSKMVVAGPWRYVSGYVTEACQVLLGIRVLFRPRGGEGQDESDPLPLQMHRELKSSGVECNWSVTQLGCKSISFTLCESGGGGDWGRNGEEMGNLHLFPDICKNTYPTTYNFCNSLKNKIVLCRLTRRSYSNGDSCHYDQAHTQESNNIFISKLLPTDSNGLIYKTLCF